MGRLREVPIDGAAISVCPSWRPNEQVRSAEAAFGNLPSARASAGTSSQLDRTQGGFPAQFETGRPGSTVRRNTGTNQPGRRQLRLLWMVRCLDGRVDRAPTQKDPSSSAVGTPALRLVNVWMNGFFRVSLRGMVDEDWQGVLRLRWQVDLMRTGFAPSSDGDRRCESIGALTLACSASRHSGTAWVERCSGTRLCRLGGVSRTDGRSLRGWRNVGKADRSNSWKRSA